MMLAKPILTKLEVDTALTLIGMRKLFVFGAFLYADLVSKKVFP